MSAGYEVAAVGLGREVIPKVRSWRPDMLTLDVLLPDMDGFEVLRELKASPDMANVPVIVLSVLHDRENGLQLGAADYLTKPIRGKELLDSVERALGELAGAKGRSILVVDDEPDVRRWLRDALGVHGFRVAEAGDGQAAMEQVERERPDLILLDLKMPRMDGYTALKQLKSDPGKADIPIVVLTASSINKERDEMRLLDMGAKRFLTKPIAVDELVGEIEQQLAAKVKAKE
jgi:CheY-like chemotaxis protein